jgi:hypothetical protein
LDRRRSGHHSQSGCGAEEENPQPLPGFESPIIQPVAQRYTTESSLENKLQIQIYKYFMAIYVFYFMKFSIL